MYIIFLLFCLYSINAFKNAWVLWSLCIISCYYIKLIIRNTNNTSVYKSIRYVLWLIKEIYISTVATSLVILQNKQISNIQKSICALQKNDVATACLANSITLTPGTTTILQQGGIITVHCLQKENINSVENMANQVRKCF